MAALSISIVLRALEMRRESEFIVTRSYLRRVRQTTLERVCLNLVKHDAKPAKIERHENSAIESADHLALLDACIAEVG